MTALETRPLAPGRVLVSVGMPVYEGAAFIGQALDSVLAQDHEHLELIVSDDASTDDTAEICAAYAARDRRVRVERQPRNLGGMRNFERVLDGARGKYFTWLAQDDACDPRYLTAMLEVLEGDPRVVLCCSSMRIIDAQGRVLGHEDLESLYPDVPWAVARRSFLDYGRSNVHLAMYGVFRREALAGLRFLETRYRGRAIMSHAEWPFLATVAGRGRIVALREPLRSYRRHARSAYHVELGTFSSVYRRVLSLRVKLRLLRVVLAAPVPRREKVPLVAHALRNLLPLTGDSRGASLPSCGR